LKDREDQVKILEVLLETQATTVYSGAFTPMAPALRTLSLAPLIGQPLKTCILAIIWELVQKPRPVSALDTAEFELLVVLLSSAAHYQTISDAVSILFSALYKQIVS
jgi:hypothetical protein